VSIYFNAHVQHCSPDGLSACGLIWHLSLGTLVPSGAVNCWRACNCCFQMLFVPFLKNLCLELFNSTAKWVYSLLVLNDLHVSTIFYDNTRLTRRSDELLWLICFCHCQVIQLCFETWDLLCALVVRVPGHRSRGPGPILGLERGPLSLEYNWGATILGRKSSGSSLERPEYGSKIRHADHVAPSIRKSRYTGSIRSDIDSVSNFYCISPILSLI
jgi:hypothetical protein